VTLQLIFISIISMVVRISTHLILPLLPSVSVEFFIVVNNYNKVLYRYRIPTVILSIAGNTETITTLYSCNPLYGDCTQTRKPIVNAVLGHNGQFKTDSSVVQQNYRAVFRSPEISSTLMNAPALRVYFPEVWIFNNVHLG
jgi:hypothetical protein